MKSHDPHKTAIVAAAALRFGGIAVAQSPSLTLPNNSAGTPDGIPGTTAVIVVEPSMTESSLTAFEKLDAPPLRVTRADTPVPWVKPLELAVLPSGEDIVETAMKVAKY